MILGHDALKKKKVSFLSGTRVNDESTWRSTGYAFVIDSNDKKALETAIQGVMKDTTFYNGKQNQNILEYKSLSTGFLIIVYAQKDETVTTKKKTEDTKTEEESKSK